MIDLLPSGARVASGQLEITNVPNLDLVESAAFALDVTAAATLAGDTLNVRIQGLYDDAAGAIRFADDFVSFTQVLGNGGAKQFLAFWRRDIVPAAPLRAPAADALAASVLFGPVPKRWRISWVIAGTGSFTFALRAALVQRRTA